ncbi:MAG: hypothetical protein COB26_05385 [Piscirickettsiaceae bacterium]|nr:MAG: hypothetical protein COB26_05385 [Piscirickettsiaceae bacterium]
MPVVRYFYEGETEKKLLQHLKDEGHLSPGRLKKHNLWNTLFSKIERTVNKTDHLYFFIDTDVTSDLSIFKNNIKRLKPYNIRLMIQHNNFEDELYFACGKIDNRALFKDLYGVTSSKEFKSKFIKESNLEGKLATNNFDYKKLWSRNADFDAFLISSGISINNLYHLKTPLRP